MSFLMAVINFLTTLNFIGFFNYKIFCKVILTGLYRAAEAEYNGLEYVSIFPQYMSYFSYIYIVVFVLALLWATYVSFIKLKIQKNS